MITTKYWVTHRMKKMNWTAVSLLAFILVLPGGSMANAASTDEAPATGATSGTEPSAQSLLDTAYDHMKKSEWWPANTAFEKVLAMQDAAPASRVEAYLGIARIYAGYGGVKGWTRVKEVCPRVLEIPASTSEQKLAARRYLVQAFMKMQERAQARQVMRDIVAMVEAPAPERISHGILLAKTSLLEQDFEGTRAELKHVSAMSGLSTIDQADIQLQIALSFYQAQDYDRAKPELLKVLDMTGAKSNCYRPGHDNPYSPSLEVELRLHLRKMIPTEQQRIIALFIGSSMTMRRGMPWMVAQIAASAPEGRPRILPCIFGRNGTRIDTFWNDGDLPGTARHLIATEPWDAVVIETFYSLTPEELSKYGGGFAELARSHHARPIFYSAPAAKAHPYPVGHREAQEAVLALGRTLDVPVAPAVAGYLTFLGDEPTADRLGILYSDWIHSTERGSYLIACSIYSAMTGYSAIGLAHPGLSAEDGLALQEAAWKAYCENKPIEMKP